MLRPKSKEIFLLSVPIAFLAGFALLMQQSRGDGALTLVSSRIGPAKSGGVGTQIECVVKYASPSPVPEFITRPNYACLSWQIVDGRGKAVSFNTSGVGAGPIGDYEYDFTFQFPLAQVPKSAGKLTFKVVVKVSDKTLPISIIVRKS